MLGSVLRWSRTNHKLSLGVQSLVNNGHIPTGGGRGTESQSVGERGVAQRGTGCHWPNAMTDTSQRRMAMWQPLGVFML